MWTWIVHYLQSKTKWLEAEPQSLDRIPWGMMKRGFTTSPQKVNNKSKAWCQSGEPASRKAKFLFSGCCVLRRPRNSIDSLCAQSAQRYNHHCCDMLRFQTTCGPFFARKDRVYLLDQKMSCFSKTTKNFILLVWFNNSCRNSIGLFWSIGHILRTFLCVFHLFSKHLDDRRFHTVAEL